MAFDPILDALMAADPTLGQAPVDPYGAGVNEFGFDPTAGQAPLDPYGAPAPAPAHPAPPAPSQDPGLTGAGASRSAVNMGTFDTFQAGKPASRYDRKLADIGKAVAADFEQESAQRRDLAEREKALVRDTAAIEADKATDVAGAQTKLADKQTEMVAQMQTFHDAAWQRVQQAGTDYQQSLATLRAARVDPKAYYRDMSEGERAENNVKHFLAIQMLGTGKPGFMEVGQAMLNQMDKDVQRNIDAQVENLRKDKDVAEGFRAAWQLAASTAVSEEQAKERMKGMVLQSMKDSLTAEIATKYDSDLARAAGEQAVMEIDKKILETDIKQKEAARKFWLDQAELVTRKYIADQQVSIQKDQIALEREKLDAARGPGFDEALLVADPESGELRYEAKSKEDKKIIDDIALSAQNFQRAMMELDTAVRASNGRVLGGSRSLLALKNSKDQKVAALANRILYSYSKMMDPSARAVTDRDYENADKSIPIMGIFSRADGLEARNAIRQLTVLETRGAFQQYTRDFDSRKLAARGLPTHGAQVPVQQGVGAAAFEEPPVTTPLEEKAGALKSPQTRGVEQRDPGEDDRNWLTFLRDDAPRAMKQRWFSAGYRDKWAQARGRESNVDDLGELRVPDWVGPMNDIAVMANDKRLPEEQRRRSRTELFRIMRMADAKEKNRDVTDDDLDRAFYAKSLLGFDTSKE